MTGNGFALFLSSILMVVHTTKTKNPWEDVNSVNTIASIPVDHMRSNHGTYS